MWREEISTGSAGRGGAREAESPWLVDAAARSARPARTGVQRDGGKTCGRNFLPRQRKADEKEAGRDLKRLSNLKSTPKTPLLEMRMACRYKFIVPPPRIFTALALLSALAAADWG
ncbi:unnamed protein product [Rangifer tarandus platyrhynchus]|uniref:Uncharacterized protein n=3 Tax=Rangifer tarandus platyrhynchus TaxID=3082113 RepID=A0ABN8ZBB6_RANTA|nr:unnamed protein product [Rangifer tarandus platyrhynchus]CAI9703871.1 unnamed protein product [Rangifer tarandus platyrhynchus]